MIYNESLIIDGITVNAAAERLGKSATHVRRLVKRGLLEKVYTGARCGGKEGGTEGYLIKEESLKEYQKERRSE